MDKTTNLHTGPYLTTPNSNSTICTSTHQPRLLGTPLYLQHTQTLLDLMSPQDLERHNERVRHQIVVHSCVENLDGAVVRGRGKKGVFGVEVQGTNSTGVIPVR